MDDGWKSSFRKRHRTLFTKAHKLHSQAPDNIRIHIVVQRVAEDDEMTFCWNSHPHMPGWPLTREKMVSDTNGHQPEIVPVSDVSRVSRIARP